MEESLLVWLDNAYEAVKLSFDAVDDIIQPKNEEEESLQSKISVVATHIFSLTSNYTTEDLYCAINKHFDFDLTEVLSESKMRVIEACLICAVSSDDRALFVQGIMELSPDIQALLMTTIKNNMNEYLPHDDLEKDEEVVDLDKTMELSDSMKGEVEETDAETSVIVMGRDVDISNNKVEASYDQCDEDGVSDMNGSGYCDIDEENDEAEIEFKEQPPNMGMFQREGLEETANSSLSISMSSAACFQCSVCSEKSSSIEILQAELDASIQREREIESKLKAEVAIQMNKLVDAELMVIEREEQIAHRDITINEANKRINELEDLLKEQMKMTHKLELLQDELDVLRPKAEKADSSERQLERLRERLDELNGVKQQMKAESSAHEETHSRLLIAEQELDTLRKTKVQLEEYRSQYAESVIKIEELSMRLKKSDEDMNRLLRDNECLNDGQHGHLVQSQHLMEELLATSEQLREVERMGGVGDGMSELNPALMQELNRLRAENETLTSKLDSTSLESLDRLEKELADQRCMCSSLQQKWMTTKDSLAIALVTITSLQSKIAGLEIDLYNINNRFSESTAMVEEEIGSIRISHKRKVDHLLQSHFHTNSLLHMGQIAMKTEILEHLNHTQEDLDENRRCVADLQESKANLEKSLENTKQSLEDECNQRSNDKDSFESKIMQITEDYKENVATLNSQSEERIQQLTHLHNQSLASECEKSRGLAADVEEERIKRRRVEREKKYVETESHRYKTQLQVAGNSNGNEITAALKEMKTMQQQLDAARAEIQMLKSRGQGNSSEHMVVDNVNDTDFPLSSLVEPLPVTSLSSSSTSTTVNRLGSSRPVRVKVADRDCNMLSQQSSNNVSSTIAHGISTSNSNGNGISISSNSGVNSTSTSNSSSNMFGYLEQAELTDKKIEQFTRERREMIAKNLEENKERMELSQKLLNSEKEVASLKSKVTKITLEKERLERKIAKNNDSTSTSTSTITTEEDEVAIENKKSAQQQQQQQKAQKTIVTRKRVALETL